MTRTEAITLRSTRTCTPSVFARVGATDSSSAVRWLWIAGGVGVVLLAYQSEAVLSLVSFGALGFLGYHFVRFAFSETEKGE